MIFDAVSNHKFGMLSIRTFKSHISREKGPMEKEFAEELPMMSSLVSFHQQLPTLREIEDLLVMEAMQRSNNNQSIAALSLGISRQALNKRLSKMNPS